MLKIIKRDKKEIKKNREFMFFSVLWNIIKKNIKLISRSKTSSLIVILGPLIIIALVGAAYNTSNIYDIRIGVYSGKYTDLANSIVDGLGGQQFSIMKFGSKEECINSLKFAQVHVCVVIPDDLEIGIDEPLNFHVDQSRVNLVWIIIDAVTSKLSSKSSEISLQLTSSIIGTLRDAGDKLNENKDNLDNVNEVNQEILNNLESTGKELSTVDPDLVKAIDLGKISQKLEDSISENNLSKSSFNEVFKTITNIKNNTEILGKNLELVTKGTVENINNVKSNIESNINSVNELKVLLSGINTNINTVTGTSAETVVAPIKTHITPIVAEKTHLSFIFPTLIVLIIMLISLLLSSWLVISEKTNSAFFRNFITPVKDGMFLLGHFITNVYILTLQLVIIFGVAFLFFKGSLIQVLGSLIIALIFIVSIFVLVGIFIGYIFKSEETAMLATISIASLFLFFSSTILPLETLPESLKRVADFNPFVVSEGILKKIMLFKSGLVGVYEHIMVLVVYILVIGILAYGAQKFSKTRVE